MLFLWHGIGPQGGGWRPTGSLDSCKAILLRFTCKTATLGRMRSNRPAKNKTNEQMKLIPQIQEQHLSIYIHHERSILQYLKSPSSATAFRNMPTTNKASPGYPATSGGFYYPPELDFDIFRKLCDYFIVGLPSRAPGT